MLSCTPKAQSKHGSRLSILHTTEWSSCADTIDPDGELIRWMADAAMRDTTVEGAEESAVFCSSAVKYGITEAGGVVSTACKRQSGDT